MRNMIVSAGSKELQEFTLALLNQLQYTKLQICYNLFAILDIAVSLFSKLRAKILVFDLKIIN